MKAPHVSPNTQPAQPDVDPALLNSITQWANDKLTAVNVPGPSMATTQLICIEFLRILEVARAQATPQSPQQAPVRSAAEWRDFALNNSDLVGLEQLIEMVQAEAHPTVPAPPAGSELVELFNDSNGFFRKIGCCDGMITGILELKREIGDILHNPIPARFTKRVAAREARLKPLRSVHARIEEQLRSLQKHNEEAKANDTINRAYAAFARPLERAALTQPVNTGPSAEEAARQICKVDHGVWEVYGPYHDKWRLVPAKVAAIIQRALEASAHLVAAPGVGPITSDKSDWRDHYPSNERAYIPLAGGYEFQTKGKGSTARLLLPNGDRVPFADAGHVIAALEAMVRAQHAALAAHKAQPVADAPVCPTCNGDDRGAPCAYPSEGQPGCLRDKRLNPVAGVRKFSLGQRVTKTKGSNWMGKVVGFYSTELTPVGYAVESESEVGSVQIYPEAALTEATEAVADVRGMVAAIETDEKTCRSYIPLAGGYEFQTKGTGSTARLLCPDGSRVPFSDPDHVTKALEDMAFAQHAALASARHAMGGETENQNKGQK